MAFRQLVSRLHLRGFQSRSILPAVQTSTSSIHTTSSNLIYNPHKYKDDENNVFNEYSFVERARPVMHQEMMKMKNRELGVARAVGVPLVILVLSYFAYLISSMENSSFMEPGVTEPVAQKPDEQ